jgi:hypothetical protein
MQMYGADGRKVLRIPSLSTKRNRTERQIRQQKDNTTNDREF